MKTIILILWGMLCTGSLISQVSITNDGNPAARTAMLEIKSTGKGFLLPRMTRIQIGSIAYPEDGLQVYCLTDGKIYIYVAPESEWKEVAYGTSTITPPAACGVSLTVNHTVGQVAPVTKTVTYGTVTNVAGEPAKCWITSNLGADHQASEVNDATEASAGWYWQFNRKQGYRYTGSTLTPAWTINEINENSNWLAENDPCNIELGANWRIPTYTEWANVKAAGGWTNWYGPWGSLLKLHAAGYLENSGSFYERGVTGHYWPSTTSWPSDVLLLIFRSDYCSLNDLMKATGNSLRCIMEIPSQTVPSVNTLDATNITDITATGGGYVTTGGGCAVTVRGLCWSASSSPTIANDHTIDGSGNGSFQSLITGLTPNTLYYTRAYATNAIGTAYGNLVTFTTAQSFSCGSSISKDHLAGSVAPVDKTSVYGTVTNIAGETSKCWITQNLGANHQASSATDPTEESAGWYWQFNRVQGYKHDGTNITPATTWITSIDQDAEWLPVNDPCAWLIGGGWRIPTSTEWNNVDVAGGWSSLNNVWNSTMKLHAGGWLGYTAGELHERGATAFQWTGTQSDNSFGHSLYYDSSESTMGTTSKADGFSVRCIKE